LDFAEVDDGIGFAGGSTHEGAEPGVEFIEFKGFYEIVIRAKVEAGDAVVKGIAGGEDQDRHFVAFDAELAEDAPAIHDGEHDVENDGVVMPIGSLEKAIAAVGGGIDGISLFTKRLREDGQQIGFIFDDQESHFYALFGVRRPTVPANFGIGIP